MTPRTSWASSTKTRQTTQTRQAPQVRGLASAPARFALRARTSTRVRRFLVLGMVIVLAVGAGVGWLALGSPWLRVKNVTYRGAQDRAQEKLIAEAATIPLGQPLVEVDTDAIATRIIGLGMLARVDVTRSFPDRLVVTVQSREPVIAFKTADGSIAVVDKDGVPFATVTRAPAGLPLVAIDGAVDQADFKAAAQVVAALDATTRGNVSDLRVDGSGTLTFKLGKIKVIWGSADDSAVKATVVTRLASEPDVGTINVTAPSDPVVRR